MQQKKDWDKNIITKYHCPLRFQGNAINESIEEFKENLSNLNNNQKIKEGTFPINVDKWTEGLSTISNPKREFVVFTNVRLDFTKEDFDKKDNEAAIANSFNDSLQFANDILNTTSSSFGKKKVKKTSTRSFRKRGRRRAPSGTEIL